MIIRSRSPLRLGLAGGGTDVSPYSDEFGGCVLNATINMYAYCTLEAIESGVEFNAKDLDIKLDLPSSASFDIDGELALHKAVYNRVVSDFNDGQPLNVRITTYSDAPPGSGLGSSSTMVVAILQAYQQYLGLPLGEYDIAHLAFEIERIDCKLSGGKQDQYATAFGGFNFMEFYADDRVIVNPLRLKTKILNELESRMLLFFTGTSRDSAKIIEDQVKSTSSSNTDALDSMHSVKEYAYRMKESLLRSDIDGVSDILSEAWKAKKQTSKSISNPHIENLCDLAFAAGASSLKVSGAGGGGFMMIMSDPNDRLDIMTALEALGGYFVKFSFTKEGVESWSIK